MDLFTLASGSWWYEFWNSIWLLVCQGIYIFIGALYQVYEKVASVNLFSADVFEEITGRIYIVMGIAMLFIFAYNLILLIINPDEKKGTSNMTKVIKETIISLVLVILLPTIFNYLYVFQSDVLESNIIGNIVLGNVGSTSNNSTNCKDGDYDCTCNFEGYGLENYNNDKGWRFWASSTTDKTQFITDACNSYKNDKTASQRGAYAIAPTIFSAFYRPANFDFTDCVNYLQTKDESVIKEDEDKKICVNYFYDVTASKYTGNIRPFSNDTYLKDIISDSSKESMEFHWIMAVVAGGLAVYMFLCYAMEVGVRVAKLGFLQLISPIPVMMRIIPGQKEKIFTKWLNHMKTTYLDVFIRVLIIDFALFGISLVPDVMSTLWNSSTTGDGNFFIKALATVFVILGILKFAQDAPALFKEFFGDAGSFKLRSPGKQIDDNKVLKGTVGAIGSVGAVTAKRIMDIPNSYRQISEANGAKEKWKAFRSGSFNVARTLSQQKGALQKGYKYGSEAHNIDDMRNYTFGAAAEEMTKPTIGQKFQAFGRKETQAIKNFYTGEYEAFDSPAELAKAKALDNVSAALKKLEDKLDGNTLVKAANTSVEAIREHIKKGEAFEFTLDNTTYNEQNMQQFGGMEKILDLLEKYQKERVGIARQAAYKKAVSDNDTEILALGKEYRDAVAENLKDVNEAIKKNTASGKDPNIITDVNVMFSNETLSGDNNIGWKDIREAGAASGKLSQDINTNATKQQQIGKQDK